MTYSPQDVADATDYVLGASLAVSRNFLDAVGPMAEAYFLYFEEVDWAWRNRRLGSDRFEIAFAHGATVFHKAGSSIGSSSARSARAPFSEYWLARSRLKFIWRFARLLWPLHWALCWALVLRRLIRRKPAHATAIARAALGLKP
jgi:GT2 family glycosyltransferase